LVAEYADIFHALDKLKVARRLSVQLKGVRRILPVLLEVNVSGELSKAGFACHEWETNQKQQADLLRVVEEITSISSLHIQGLMTMAPWGVSESDISTVFKRTQALAQWLKEVKPQVNWSTLSMGMTDDFPLAIVAGSTHIRIGRALFGNCK
jgi:pyridoxal phosphate enzyme (YggS family)